MTALTKLFLALSIGAVAAGCAGGPAANAPTNTAASQPAAESSPREQRTPTAVAVANDAPPAAVTDNSPAGSQDSPSATYKTAYSIRQKKDVQSLKQVMSRDTLTYFAEIGKAQKKSLDQTLALLVEQEQAPKAETRNERINGDRAVLEFKDASGKWLPMDFVKEDGVWKITLSKVAPQKGKQPAAPKR